MSILEEKLNSSLESRTKKQRNRQFSIENDFRSWFRIKIPFLTMIFESTFEEKRIFDFFIFKCLKLRKREIYEIFKMLKIFWRFWNEQNDVTKDARCMNIKSWAESSPSGLTVAQVAHRGLTIHYWKKTIIGNFWSR